MRGEIVQLKNFSHGKSLYFNRISHEYHRFLVTIFSNKKSLILKIMLCLDFIDPPENHYLFHQSLADVVYILKITCKKILYIGYQSWRKKKLSFEYKISMNTSIGNEMIIYFSNSPILCIFYQFSMLLFSFYSLQYILLRMSSIACNICSLYIIVISSSCKVQIFCPT